MIQEIISSTNSDEWKAFMLGFGLAATVRVFRAAIRRIKDIGGY